MSGSSLLYMTHWRPQGAHATPALGCATVPVLTGGRHCFAGLVRVGCGGAARDVYSQPEWEVVPCRALMSACEVLAAEGRLGCIAVQRSAEVELLLLNDTCHVLCYHGPKDSVHLTDRNEHLSNKDPEHVCKAQALVAKARSWSVSSPASRRPSSAVR